MPSLAQSADSLEEFLSDPILTMACVLLIVVSIGYIIVTRLIARRYKKAALRDRRRAEQMRANERDIWSYPP
jgi:hypothetical protein